LLQTKPVVVVVVVVVVVEDDDHHQRRRESCFDGLPFVVVVTATTLPFFYIASPSLIDFTHSHSNNLSPLILNTLI
jgi:hypothetical protein